MSTHVKAFILILVLGTIGIVGYKFALPHLMDRSQRSTSDAAATHGKITIGVDSWVGYFPLCSAAMEKRTRAEGYALRCVDDQADYPARMKQLASGELDFAVATVDAYVLNGAQVDFPATIVAVIDESKGGDAIVARRSKIPNLEALRAHPDTRIAYTPASPSEHLLKSIAVHFDLPQLADRKRSWKVAASGSADALAKLKSGAADVAVIWQPDVAKALTDPDLVKLIGTDDTEKLIVDVLLASRRVIADKPELVGAVLRQYFATLKEYGQSPQQLHRDVAESTKLADDQVDAMLSGVQWASLNDNGALWFGITPTGLPEQEGLIGAIKGATEVLVASGDFAASPLPDQDPYRITNRQFLSTLYLAQAASGGKVSNEGSLGRHYEALDDAGWQKLREVGTLKIEPISFSRGTATLDDESHASLTSIADKLAHYPNYRLLVKGHSGPGGDEPANLELSKRRAAAVAEYLIGTWSMDANRVRAIGYGSSQPLPRLPDENDRAYGYRLPRVEVVLVSERF
jgi:outer membrane protein OmpA-like peptidoglycan-associated protein